MTPDRAIAAGHPHATKVLTPGGWIEMGALKVGDKAIGRDGQPTEILEFVDCPTSDVYEVAFSDKTIALCGLQQPWLVREKGADRSRQPKREKILSTEDVAAQIAYPDGTSKWRAASLSAPVYQSGAVVLPVSPYTMGILLGDGSFRALTSIRVTTVDEEVLEYMLEELNGDYVFKLIEKREGKAPSYTISPRDSSVKSMVTISRELSLYGTKSTTKFVPTLYLEARVEDRIHLFRGLMDSDGSVRIKDNHVEFSSSSLSLAEGVVSLVQSLGGTANINVKAKPRYTYKGEQRTGCPHYRVSIQMPSGINPFRLTRKARRYHERTHYKPIKIIRSVEKVGSQNMRAIRVDSEDGLYAIEGCILACGFTGI